MAKLWDLPEISRWWLPDHQGYPRLIQNIRAFIEDRTIHFKGQTKIEDVRDMKALLSKLSISDK